MNAAAEKPNGFILEKFFSEQRNRGSIFFLTGRGYEVRYREQAISIENDVGSNIVPSMFIFLSIKELPL
jgi:hypothetical protein